MDDVGVDALWVALGLAMFAYGGAGLVLFYIQMGRWPIHSPAPTSGDPVWELVRLDPCAVRLRHERTRGLLPLFWSVYLPATFMLLAADTFSIAALTLSLMCNRTQDQMSIAHASDTSRIAAAVRSLAVSARSYMIPGAVPCTSPSTLFCTRS